MTIKELLEKTPASVTIVDHNSECDITPWNVFYNAFKDCIIDTIDAAPDGGLHVTLKTELVKKEG